MIRVFGACSQTACARLAAKGMETPPPVETMPDIRLKMVRQRLFLAVQSFVIVKTQCFGKCSSGRGDRKVRLLMIVR